MPDDASTTCRRREEHQRQLDDIRSMNVGDADRARLVSAYLDGLIHLGAESQGATLAQDGQQRVGLGNDTSRR